VPPALPPSNYIPVAYVRDVRDLQSVYNRQKPVEIYEAINDAYFRFCAEYRNINNNNEKLTALGPKITDLLGKLNNSRYKLTISDAAELKYILNISNHQKGSNTSTRGLYNGDLLENGNSITVELNGTHKRSYRMYIIQDLKSILSENRGGNH